MGKKIILDTNFLMACIQFKVDMFSEIERICNFNYELCVFDKTIGELSDIIAKQGTKKRAYAKVALSIIRIKKIRELSTSHAQKTHLDDIIVDISDENCVVATQDKFLKGRLKAKNISIITMRQKKYLIIEKFK